MTEELSTANEPEPVDFGILTEAVLLRRYGPRLTLREVAEILKISLSGLKGLLNSGRLDLPSYLAQGRRFVDFRDLARYLDACAINAREEIEERQRARRRAESARMKRSRRRKMPEASADE
jgi:hypothetical protein